MSNIMPAKEALAMLGLSVEEVEQAIAEADERRKHPERHICICGHAKVRHYIDKDNPEIVICKPGRWSCECGKFHAVLQVHDTRDFMFASEGPGKDHALTKGIVKAHLKERAIEWLEGARVCSFCEATENLTIYPFTGSPKQGWRVVREQEKETNVGRRNAFVCDACVVNL